MDRHMVTVQIRFPAVVLDTTEAVKFVVAAVEFEKDPLTVLDQA